MIDNEEIQKALCDLMQNDLLDPKDVVEAAKDKDSPLHNYFEWDDTEAARKYREEQARELIRSVKVTINEPEKLIYRAFVSVPTDREAGAGYRRTEQVIQSDILRVQLVEEINNQICRWENRARVLGALIDFEGMRAVIKKGSKKK